MNGNFNNIQIVKRISVTLFNVCASSDLSLLGSVFNRRSWKKMRSECYYFGAMLQGLWEISQLGLEPVPQQWKLRSLNHWAAREFPECYFWLCHFGLCCVLLFFLALSEPRNKARNPLRNQATTIVEAFPFDLGSGSGGAEFNWSSGFLFLHQMHEHFIKC